jgi:hypothetical protein
MYNRNQGVGLVIVACSYQIISQTCTYLNAQKIAFGPECAGDQRNALTS